MSGARCMFCDRDIERPGSPRVLSEVVGYTRPRSAGGANHIVGRRLTGRLVCESCALRVERGLDPGQRTILDA